MRGVIIALTAVLLGCGPSADEPGAPTAGIPPVPRSRTLIMDCAEMGVCSGQFRDYNSYNPFFPGTTSRTGYNFLYEPLYYYNAFRETDNLIPWIATDHAFNEDHTQVTIHLRRGVEWSDGVPLTAHDLVFSLELHKQHAPVLIFSTDMETWVDTAVAVDDYTARIDLNAPNPRFVFNYLTHDFGIGMTIVPQHIWQDVDPETFTNYDPAKGWPVMTGPYKLVHSSPQQRIWDRRDDWWAAEIGFQELPQVQRLIYLPYMDETKRVQNLIGNNIDTCLDLRPPNIQSALDGNPSITTWTGRDVPYGYLDFWPIALGFNDLEEPFSDPEIRRAIDRAIDRDQLVEIGWAGAGSAALLPFPDFPPMRRFTDPIKDLVAASGVGTFDPSRTAEIMTRKGWQRDAEGYWTRDGERLKIVIDITPIFQDFTPVLVAQLQRAGFAASFRMTSDYYTRQTQGEAKAYINGHGGSVRDPYYTLSFYHSRHVLPTGEAAQYFWRWSNPEFDAIVDEMGRTATDDPALHGLFRRAMEIWLRELPSIPLLQWYHRIPHNETYWTNWPSEGNPYIHTAYWHRTWLLVLLGLRPVQ